jgi:hypothetical protein
MAGGRMAGLSPGFYPVNLGMKCQSARGGIAPQRIQKWRPGGFRSSVHALELTVPHKTVAELL